MTSTAKDLLKHAGKGWASEDMYDPDRYVPRRRNFSFVAWILAFILGMILLWFSSAHAASYLMADIAYTEPVDDALASTTLHVKPDGLRKRSYTIPATSISGGGIVKKAVKIPLTSGVGRASFWATAKDAAGNVGAASDILVLKVQVVEE